MYATQVTMCLVLLNLYFCIGADDKKNTSQQGTQKSLGPEFADVYKENEYKFAKGEGKALGLPPEGTQNLVYLDEFLGQLVAYDVGALARNKSEVPVDRNDTQANQNGKVAAVIGRTIGEEAVNATGMDKMPGIKEIAKDVPELNSLIAVLIARFFGTTGDIGTAIQNNSSQDIIKDVLKYPDVNNKSS